jgi:hypothetical protein
MDAGKPKQDVLNNPDAEGLLRDALARAQARLDAAHHTIDQLEKEIAELRKLLPSATNAKVNEPFSVRSEEKRQDARGKKAKRKKLKKQRRGRIANEEKIKRAERTEDVYPKNVPPEQCKLSHVRVIWRLTNGGQGGQAVLVAYRVFRHKKRYGVIPGALGRSEFGLEIVIT